MEINAYPDSNALAVELKKFQQEGCIALKCVYGAAVAIIQEYEHGNGELCLMNLQNTKQYKEVMLDYLRYLSTIMEDFDERTDHRGCHG